MAVQKQKRSGIDRRQANYVFFPLRMRPGKCKRSTHSQTVERVCKCCGACGEAV